ncbi:MAG: UDP-N-acetylglucosamine 4,6-dehydratase (inverting) [Alphaproteobacteria bacterium]|nr:UDP-N-acetylglucosamine 4,6-dehydratase (inverting) [Alphaproteobacteria bacterium]
MPSKVKFPAVDLNGKSILVTGGTGSFGQAFIRRVVATFKPHRLIVFSRDEQKQVDLAQELSPATHPCLRYFIGDVRDLGRLEMAMREVDYVIHAAALKHVPVAEYNPFECINTNVMGAENVVKAAIRAGVKRVVALSTDKAANPINLYGASKLASDKIFIAANNLTGHRGPHFAVVRYGNVYGSRGSVVPLFKKLIAAGAKELPITDPRMTRFWITLEQGVAMVLSSLAEMRGGEIFVPKIPSMKVVDLAKAMAPRLPHKLVGIRPGEKLHEVLITEDDSRTAVDIGDRYVIEPAIVTWSRKSFREDGAKPLAESFRYASDTNDQWLDQAGLEALL